MSFIRAHTRRNSHSINGNFLVSGADRSRSRPCKWIIIIIIWFYWKTHPAWTHLSKRMESCMRTSQRDINVALRIISVARIAPVYALRCPELEALGLISQKFVRIHTVGQRVDLEQSADRCWYVRLLISSTKFWWGNNFKRWSILESSHRWLWLK